MQRLTSNPLPRHPGGGPVFRSPRARLGFGGVRSGLGSAVHPMPTVLHGKSKDSGSLPDQKACQIYSKPQTYRNDSEGIQGTAVTAVMISILNKPASHPPLARRLPTCSCNDPAKHRTNLRSHQEYNADSSRLKNATFLRTKGNQS